MTRDLAGHLSFAPHMLGLCSGSPAAAGKDGDANSDTSPMGLEPFILLPEDGHRLLSS